MIYLFDLFFFWKEFELKDYLTLAAKFESNCYEVCASNEGPEFADGDALYLVSSFFNHSCSPNIDRGNSKTNSMEFYANKSILMGEELTIAYFSFTNISAKERRKQIHEMRGFLCQCELCVRGEDSPSSRPVGSEDSPPSQP